MMLITSLFLQLHSFESRISCLLRTIFIHILKTPTSGLWSDCKSVPEYVLTEENARNFYIACWPRYNWFDFWVCFLHIDDFQMYNLLGDSWKKIFIMMSLCSSAHIFNSSPAHSFLPDPMWSNVFSRAPFAHLRVEIFHDYYQILFWKFSQQRSNLCIKLFKTLLPRCMVKHNRQCPCMYM